MPDLPRAWSAVRGLHYSRGLAAVRFAHSRAPGLGHLPRRGHLLPEALRSAQEKVLASLSACCACLRVPAFLIPFRACVTTRQAPETKTAFNPSSFYGMAFVQFGYGMHKCPAEKYAMTLLNSFFSVLVRTRSVELKVSVRSKPLLPSSLTSFNEPSSPSSCAHRTTSCRCPSTRPRLAPPRPPATS